MEKIHTLSLRFEEDEREKCHSCGEQVNEHSNFCPSCGSSDFSAAAENIGQPFQQSDDPAQTPPPIDPPADQARRVEANEAGNKGNGNIIAGIVGAFLFSVIGGLLYFVIYQIGYIAGICGLVIFVLADFGYGLFAGTKNKVSLVRLISAIVATIVMIYLAEYCCISFEVFQVFKEEGITIFDAVRAVPLFLEEPELRNAFAGDLAFAYLFGFAATIGNIVNIVKARKENKV